MRTLAIVAIALGITACGTTDSTQLSNVQVSFATQRPTASFHTAARADSLTEGGNTLVITRAEIVLREVELKRVETAGCDEEDACETFETGPVLIDLPLGPGTQQTFALNISAGLYDEIEFDIHKPDDGDPVDQAFVAANPAFAEISIRVQGTYNGEPFTYTTDLNVEQELALNPALEVTAGSSPVNLTILIDLATWFRDESGTLISPALANKDQPFESIVRNRIQQSVEAFEDQDRDANDDDD